MANVSKRIGCIGPVHACFTGMRQVISSISVFFYLLIFDAFQILMNSSDIYHGRLACDA